VAALNLRVGDPEYQVPRPPRRTVDPWSSTARRWDAVARLGHVRQREQVTGGLAVQRQQTGPVGPCHHRADAHGAAAMPGTPAASRAAAPARWHRGTGHLHCRRGG